MLLAAIALAAPTPSFAQQINIPSVSLVSNLSASSPLYGQTFKALNGRMDNFTMWLGAVAFNAGTFQFKAGIGTWNGTAVGSVLWTSGTMSNPDRLSGMPTTFQSYTFDTQGLTLINGASYVAFLSYEGGGGGRSIGQDPSNSYKDGRFVYSASSNPASTWTGTDFGELDLALTANFSDPTTVPEPSTAALICGGALLLAAAAKSQRCRARHKAI